MAASMLARLTRFTFVAAAAAGLASCGFNSIPTSEEAAKAKWADVQNQYQRRSDLVPNLVATVKGYAKQEQDTLVKVTEARAKATSIQVSAADVTDPDKMAQYQAAQGQLSQGLGRLLASVEAYPDLKSNQNFLALQSQLEGTENRIAVARRDYNEAVHHDPHLSRNHRREDHLRREANGALCCHRRRRNRADGELRRPGCSGSSSGERQRTGGSGQQGGGRVRPR